MAPLRSANVIESDIAYQDGHDVLNPGDASPGLCAREHAPAAVGEKLPKRYIRRRHMVAGMSMLGTMTIYFQRICISIAAQISSKQDGAYTMVSEYEWSSSQQGFFLAAFYIGYTVWQLPAAFLIRLIGPSRVFALGIFWSSIFTMLTPIAADFSFSLAIVCRILVGFGQGPEYPAASVLVAHWAPPLERSQLISVLCSGAWLGTFVCYPLSAELLQQFGWRTVLYAFGAWGLAFSIVYKLLVSDTPQKDAHIHEVELDFIEESQLGNMDPMRNQSAESLCIIISQAFRSRAVWALICAAVCNNFGSYMLLSEAPTFLHKFLQFSEEAAGVLSLVPFLVVWLVTILSGLFADYLVRRGRLKLVKIRRLCFAIAEMPTACLLICAGYAPKWLSFACFIVAVGCNGFFNCAISANVIDIGGRHSGLIYALVNTAGTIPAVLAEPMFGIFTDKFGYVQGFRISFWICLALYGIGTLVFGVASSGKPFVHKLDAESLVRPNSS